MKVVYLAHPIGAPTPELIRENVRIAKSLLTKLQKTNPDVAIVAPWITWIECGDDDSDPKQRELGLRRDVAVAVLCDEIWLVGNRISDGMRLEAQAMRGVGKPVIDLTGWVV